MRSISFTSSSDEKVPAEVSGVCRFGTGLGFRSGPVDLSGLLKMDDYRFQDYSAMLKGG